MPDREGTPPRIKGPIGARPPVILRPGRLPKLVTQIARLVRASHLSAGEWRQLVRDVRIASAIPPRSTIPRRLPDVLTVDELRRMFEQAYREKKAARGLMLRTLFETGVRVAELTAIEIGDLDLLERTCRVRQGKGSRDRIVVFSADLAQQLALHIGRRVRGALFESNRHLPVSRRWVQYVVHAVALRAGVTKRVHPHSYRHAMATYLLDRGMPLHEIQAQLGHADPKTTLIYTQLSVEKRRQEYDKAMVGIGGAGLPAPNEQRRPR